MSSLFLQPRILAFSEGNTYILIILPLSAISTLKTLKKHVWEVLLKHSSLHKRKAQLLAETKFLVLAVELGIISQ